MIDPLRDRVDFTDRSPTPHHAVAEGGPGLDEFRFQRLSGRECLGLTTGYRADLSCAKLGRGPVLRSNAAQFYSTEAPRAVPLGSLYRGRRASWQDLLVRRDMARGSTIGTIAAARIGIPIVDVKNPMLAMDACRETTGSARVEQMIRLLAAFLSEH